MAYGEYSLDIRVVLTSDAGYYVQSYAIMGVDGPFDVGDTLDMSTVRRATAEDLESALRLQLELLNERLGEAVGANGWQGELF